jgi:photosystem II stability/assembly factor-like uncharacterized protein
MALSPNYLSDQTLYLAPGDTLVRSADGGRTWTSVSLPPSEGTASLALTDVRTLFLALGGGPPYWYPQQGLFYSGDAGRNWERLYQGGVHDVALSPDYGDDHTILIGIAGYHWNGGILKSTDNGRTWQPSREGLPWGADGVTRDIAFSPGYAEDHTVFCLSWQGLYKSTDDGTTWQRLAPVPDGAPWGSIEQFLVSPRYPHDQTVWLRGDREGQLRSTDGGTTWQQMPHTVQPIAVAEAYCPQGGDCGVELFGYTWDSEHDYVYKSFDGGMTWYCLESAVTPMPTPTPPPPTPEIPEASTLLLLAGGLAGLAGYLRRHRSKPGWRARPHRRAPNAASWHLT